MEVARDCVRHLLHNHDPDTFPVGHNGTSVSTLITQVLYPEYKMPELYLHCSHCEYHLRINNYRIGRIMYVGANAHGSTAQILENYLQHQTPQICVICNIPLDAAIHFNEPPKNVAFDVTDRDIIVSHSIKILGSTRSIVLYLKGLVYYGSFHFTCRFIDDTSS